MASDTGGTHGSRTSHRIWKVAVPLLACVLVLSSCFVLKQGESFAVGTESTRLNLVIFRNPTIVVDQIRRDQGTAVSRRFVLDQVPSSLSLTATQRAVACAASGALCLAAHLVPGVLLSWFRSDLRHRSDFANDLASARSQNDCFAWTAVPSRNFTTKPLGNSGCR